MRHQMHNYDLAAGPANDFETPLLWTSQMGSSSALQGLGEARHQL